MNIEKIIKENQELKQKLNWIAFGDDAELALRYLRKIGYVDFDEERKVYINKHNNEPFALDEEEEKAYYIKSEELNEYTEQLEYQNQELKKQVEDISEELELVRCDLHNRTSERDGYERELNECLSQQKEFIKYLEDEFTKIQNDIEKEIDNNVKYFKVERRQIITEILQKYKEITGVSDEKKMNLNKNI